MGEPFGWKDILALSTLILFYTSLGLYASYLDDTEREDTMTVRSVPEDLTDDQLVKLYREYQKMVQGGKVPRDSMIKLYSDGSCGIYSRSEGKELLHYDYYDGFRWQEGPNVEK